MNKKRTIGMLIILSLILFVFVAGYTFAKYYTVVDGGGKVGIAKWSFVARDNNNNITNISLKDTANEVSLVNGKIAPGTHGSFDIIIDATGSEVGVDYDIKVVSESNIPTNMKFSQKNNSTKYSTLKELADAELNGNINLAEENKVKTITVEWEWPFETENGDSADMLNGVNAGNYQFGLQIIGSQSKV